MKPSEREAWSTRVAELQAKAQAARDLAAAAHAHRPNSAQIANDAMLCVGGGQQGLPKKNRLQNVARATIVDGIRFASKLEADRYRELKLLQLAGDVLYTLRQVPFVAATGKVYRLDFMIIWNRSGAPEEVVTYEDTKGRLTEVSALKIAAVQDRYGINIKLLRRGDVSR
jgi:hypothetical protein